MQDWRDVPFSKGFVLTRGSFHAVAHFTPQELVGGWTLWADNATQQDQASDAQALVIIRGLWIDTSEHVAESVADGLLRSFAHGWNDFYEHIGKIAGRYVVFVIENGDVHVFNDPSGLRTVYYTEDGDIVASHLKLLARMAGKKLSGSSTRIEKDLDSTLCADVRQLLPNFALKANSGSVKRFYPMEKNRYTEWDLEDKLSRVQTLLNRVLGNVADRFGDKIAVSVTGGVDSRFILAMSRPYWHNMTGYTYGLEKARTTTFRDQMMALDQDIVNQLIDLIPLKSHQFLDIANFPKTSPEIQQTVRNNTWQNHLQGLLPAYREMFAEPGWVHLRGNGLEVVKRFWHAPSVSATVALQLLGLPESQERTKRAEQLGYSRDHYDFLMTDLLYWEVRLGKWHAEIMNEQDVVYETVLPVSTREIYEILLSFSPAERAEALALRELINRNAPLLNFIGTNDRRNLYEQFRDSKVERNAPVPLFEPRFDVTESAGDNEEVEVLHDRTLYIPADHFVKNALASALFTKVEANGALQFTINQPYECAKNRDKFSWEVLVDDKPLLECDGAATSLPVRVTVRNLRAGAEVRVGLRAHANMQGIKSWQNASWTTISAVEQTPTVVAEDMQPIATCDCPDARVPQGKTLAGSVRLMKDSARSLLRRVRSHS